MTIDTRLFGTIEIAEEKLIHFPGGIIGFPDMKTFAIIRDEEKKDSRIMWLQSMDEGEFAMPIIEPNAILEDYNPIVNDEYLSPVGELTPEQTYSVVTLTVPSDITKLTANFKAPIVINMSNNRAVQIIVEDDYLVKQPIYELLMNAKEDN